VDELLVGRGQHDRDFTHGHSPVVGWKRGYLDPRFLEVVNDTQRFCRKQVGYRLNEDQQPK
jgi:hypothetical protein